MCRTTATPTTDPDTSLASTLRLAVMRLARRMRQQRSDSALTLSQLAALATVERHGPLTPGELAAHEKVRPPSMTRLIASLEAAGVATRSPHPSDGRQVLVSVAPAGVALLREDRRRRDVWLAQQLRDLPAADREVLARASEVLERLASS